MAITACRCAVRDNLVILKRTAAHPEGTTLKTKSDLVGRHEVVARLRIIEERLKRRGVKLSKYVVEAGDELGLSVEFWTTNKKLYDALE